MNAHIRLAMLCLFLLSGSLTGTLLAQTPPDATPDLRLETFDSNQWQPGRAFAILRQPDGRMLVGGRFNRANGGLARHALLRLEQNGAIDPTFAPVFAGGGTVQVTALAVRDNAIYAGGFFDTVNGATQRSLVKLRMDGSLDPAWNSPFTSAPANNVRALAVTPAGVFVGGDLSQNNAYGLLKVAAATGALDTGWIAQTQYSPTPTPGGGNRGDVAALRAIGDDLYVGGQFGQIAGSVRSGVARISQSAPVVVRAFDAAITGRVYALAAAGNRIYLGGDYFRNGAPGSSYLSRVDAGSGAWDAAWVPGIGSSVHALDVIGDVLYAGGTFNNQPAGSARLARISTLNAAIDASWNPNANNTVLAIADSCRGRVLSGGEFLGMSGQPRNGFATFAVTHVDCIFYGDFEVH